MFENAKAAMLENSSVSTVTTTDTSRLLKYHRHMDPLPRTSLYALKVTFEPNHFTGVAVVSASGLSDVASAHASGASHTRASRTATTSATIEPVERFFLPTRRLVRALGLIRLRVSATTLTWSPPRWPRGRMSRGFLECVAAERTVPATPG